MFFTLATTYITKVRITLSLLVQALIVKHQSGPTGSTFWSHCYHITSGMPMVLICPLEKGIDLDVISLTDSFVQLNKISSNSPNRQHF